MSNNFPFRVGDKVRRRHWSDPNEHVVVTAVGRSMFLGINGDETEDDAEADWDIAWSRDGEWMLYVPPPKRYVVVCRPVLPGEKYVWDQEVIDEPTQERRFVVVEELP